jgi:opacity protein-like surface antigen
MQEQTLREDRSGHSPLDAAWTACRLLAAWVLMSAPVWAQAGPAAQDSSARLWLGGEYSNFLPGFGPASRVTGIGIYIDLSRPRWGIEGETRFLRVNGFHGEAQNHYLIGPTISIFRVRRFRPYAKLLCGIAQNRFPFSIGTGAYFAMAPGTGIDYRLSHRIALRADYEYQIWPTAPGVAGEPSNGMKPNGFSAGISYKLFGR